jgi:hypothetical protein
VKITVTFDGVVVVKERHPVKGKTTTDYVFDGVIVTTEVNASDELPDPQRIMTAAKDVFGPLMGNGHLTRLVSVEVED